MIADLMAYLDANRVNARVSRWRAAGYDDFCDSISAATDEDSWEIRSASDGALALGYTRDGRFIPWYIGRSGAFEGDALITKARIMHYRNAKHILTEMEKRERARERDDARVMDDCADDVASAVYNAATKTRVDYGAQLCP